MFISNFKVLTFSNRIGSLVSVVGISLCTLAMSFSDIFELDIIIYGVLYGFFIGYGYMAPLKNTYEHLPDRKGK